LPYIDEVTVLVTDVVALRDAESEAEVLAVLDPVEATEPGFVLMEVDPLVVPVLLSVELPELVAVVLTVV
jgi:hypothetical protein